MNDNQVSPSRPSNSVLAAVILGGLLYVAGQYVGSQPQRIQQEIEANREIQVQGTGKVEVRPDIAMVQLGVRSTNKSSAEAALQEISSKLNSVMQALKSLEIAEEDIKTSNFNINPIYDYQDGRSIPRGFEASETLEVKIRNLDNIGQVLSAVTQEGVNQAGGLTFVSEDEEELVAQAEEAAIVDAKTKAEKLAQALGARLGRVKNFSSSSVPGGPIPLYAERAIGGDQGSIPPVPAGSKETTATVTITYELQ